MFWIIKNKTNFTSLLLLIINFIYITSYNDEFPFYNKNQQAKIDKACKKNQVICPMAAAIEEIFSSITLEDITAKEELWCEILCILYSNVYARDIIFDEDIQIDPDNYTITLNNCIVLLEGKIGYKNSDTTTVDFGTFLSELKIESIHFYHKQNRKGQMLVEFHNSTIRYNYNKNNAVFSSEILNMTDQMDIIMENIYDNYLNKINYKIDMNSDKTVIFYETKNNLGNYFSFYEGPGIYNETKQITYISYIDLDYDKLVHIKSIIFFSWMNVTFEYALNNNITYNEGYFVVDNIVFEESDNKNRYDKCVLNSTSDNFNNLKNRKEIWNFILEDFKKVLNEYKSIHNNN